MPKGAVYKRWTVSDRGDAETVSRYARFGKCGNVRKSTQLPIDPACPRL